jgi:hypothetical protein
MTWGVKHNIEDLEDITQELSGLVKSAMKELADDVKKELVESIEKGDTAWPPLSETTRMISGRDKPLVNTGELMRAIQVQAGDKEALVGILIPKGESGKDLETMASVAEGGAYIKVTDKMRTWFAAKGRPLRKTTTVIRVPPRPVFDPKVEFIEGKIDEIFGDVLDNVVELL